MTSSVRLSLSCDLRESNIQKLLSGLSRRNKSVYYNFGNTIIGEMMLSLELAAHRLVTKVPLSRDITDCIFDTFLGLWFFMACLQLDITTVWSKFHMWEERKLWLRRTVKKSSNKKMRVPSQKICQPVSLA